MRDIGIVTLMSVAATAAAPVLPAARSAPLVTTKSTEQFAGCFASVQERRSAAWWFVPNGKGGTFSNLGAAASGTHISWSSATAANTARSGWRMLRPALRKPEG